MYDRMRVHLVIIILFSGSVFLPYCCNYRITVNTHCCRREFLRVEEKKCIQVREHACEKNHMWFGLFRQCFFRDFDGVVKCALDCVFCGL